VRIRVLGILDVKSKGKEIVIDTAPAPKHSQMIDIMEAPKHSMERIPARERRYRKLDLFPFSKSVIASFLFAALIGCSVQRVERPKEQETSRAKQEEHPKPSSIPTFTYRPGVGLMIEGR
jgi:hypothetical protein